MKYSEFPAFDIVGDEIVFMKGSRVDTDGTRPLPWEGYKAETFGSVARLQAGQEILQESHRRCEKDFAARYMSAVRIR